jgi:hypothetical protein
VSGLKLSKRVCRASAAEASKTNAIQQEDDPQRRLELAAAAAAVPEQQAKNQRPVPPQVLRLQHVFKRWPFGINLKTGPSAFSSTSIVGTVRIQEVMDASLPVR